MPRRSFYERDGTGASGRSDAVRHREPERQDPGGVGALAEPWTPASEGGENAGPFKLMALPHAAQAGGRAPASQLWPDLLFLGHDQCPLERRGRALRTPTTPRPASAHASA